jgi:multidrug efflux pump subunit AcrA (membrane-fusion protein)
MCDPVSIGISVAALGSLQSIAGYQQQQAQHEYESNAARQRQQLAQRNAEINYRNQKAIYDQNQAALDRQNELDMASANRAYVASQNKLQGERDKTRAQQFDLYKDSLKAYGSVFARGRSGGVNQYLASDAEREYGRDLARLGTNLGYHKTAYDLEVEQIELDAQSALNLNASKRMLVPIKEYVPEAYIGPKPSAASMVLGIGQSIVGGVQTGMSLSAPNAGSGTGKGKGKGSGVKKSKS